MGGSTVWGDDAHMPFSGRIANHETISHHLQTILNDFLRQQGNPLKVRVINAGVIGYMLYQNMIYFNHVVAKYDPDIVVSIDGHNDIMYKVGDTYEAFIHPNEAAYRSLFDAPSMWDVLHTMRRFMEARSVFLAKASDKIGQWWRGYVLLQHDRLTPKDMTREETLEWLRDYIWTVQRMNASVKLAGAEAIFMLQPEIVVDNKMLTEIEQQIRAHYYGTQYPLFKRFRPMIIQALKAEASKHAIRFEDLQDVFAYTSDTAYLDYCHLTSLGAKVVARRIADLVLPSIQGTNAAP